MHTEGEKKGREISLKEFAHVIASGNHWNSVPEICRLGQQAGISSLQSGVWMQSQSAVWSLNAVWRKDFFLLSPGTSVFAYKAFNWLCEAHSRDGEQTALVYWFKY